MKLKLKNFRCYVDKEFDFGKTGMSLLSGPSGAGKSTVLTAINFALYGTGTKVASFGKTSCRVEFEFGSIRAVRTKRPNRLVVTDTMINEEYEDAAGQAIINEKFGTTFNITSYLQQNTAKSFIMMSPIEKLAFLEQFAFQDIDLTKLKMRCRAIIKERNEELIATTSQFEMASSIFDDMTKPLKVPFPLKGKDKERAMKNEIVRYKNTLTVIKRATKKCNALEIELNDLNVLYAKLNIKSDLLGEMTEQLEKSIENKDTLDYEGDKKLSSYENQLVSALAYRELLVLQDKYDDDKDRFEAMQEIEKQELLEKIDTIRAQLWTEYTESELTETITEFKVTIKDIEVLERLKRSLKKIVVDADKLEKNKKDLEEGRVELTKKKDLLTRLKMQQEVYHCPSCEATLRFQDDDLHVFNGSVDLEDEDIDLLEKEINALNRLVNRLEYAVPEDQTKLERQEELRKEIKVVEDRYEESLPSKADMEADIEYMKEYKRSQIELSNRMSSYQKNIDDNKLSTSLKTFNESLTNQRKKIKALKKDTVNVDIDDINENELREKIQEQRRIKVLLKTVDETISRLTKSIATYEREIEDEETDHTEKHDKVRNVNDVEKLISGLTTELQELDTKRENHAKNVTLLEEYKVYKTELARYTEWKNKVKTLKAKEKEDRQRYAASTLLRDKILEAESIAIMNVVESINVHAQDFLDAFFPTDPISVRLSAFKQTKKKTTKPQINIQIDYKGMEADMSMLSGGESSRIVLAYTLALAEIFNSPLILLDECTASLDQNLTNAVIEGIRLNFPDKIVLVIAHQVVSGIFDSEIKMLPP